MLAVTLPPADMVLRASCGLSVGFSASNVFPVANRTFPGALRGSGGLAGWAGWLITRMGKLFMRLWPNFTNFERVFGVFRFVFHSLFSRPLRAARRCLPLLPLDLGRAPPYPISFCSGRQRHIGDPCKR